ncbi:hypothetical protein D9M71_649770 [compost metagenome]
MCVPLKNVVFTDCYHTQSAIFHAPQPPGGEDNPGRAGDHDRYHLQKQLSDIDMHGAGCARKRSGPWQDVHHTNGHQ